VIFVDTSTWFAGCVTADSNHQSAKAVFASTDPRLLFTTDYVLDETLTLLKARGENSRALDIGRQILEEEICQLVWI
jgi:predicted nucleic acid-binding protein